MKEAENNEPPNRELYALLHISPQASDEEIRKAYRQWAQIYHPDKYQSPQMKDIATKNFQRICEAYEILSDENKRQIYDIYGMEGVTSGLELGPNLNSFEKIKEELEKLRRQKQQEKVPTHVLPSGVILANLSLPQFLDGDGIMRGMSMSSEVQSKISKRNVIAVGGNLAVNGNSGGGAATAVLRHQISSASTMEFMASAGLRALIGLQTSRTLSAHSTATMGIAMSLRDGSINLSNSWTRQLSESTNGNIELALGSESSIAVGWRKKEEKMSAAGEIKIGTSFFGASAHYSHRFSSKSHGRIAGKIGREREEKDPQPKSAVANSPHNFFWQILAAADHAPVGEGHKMIAQDEVLQLDYLVCFSLNSQYENMCYQISALEIEVGGGRKISNFSTVRMLYSIGIQGIFYRFELHRGGQKLVIPILLSRHLNVVTATGAFIIPASLYFALKAFVFKPYHLKREKQKALENMGKTLAEVREARAVAEKAQQLLQNVGNRKRSKQLETGGLVITKAIYGNRKAFKNTYELEEHKDNLALQVIDVTLPLNFLINDSGQLKLHEGVKKSGIMGFCDPCPGEPKLLHLEYTYGDNRYEVEVDDHEELLIPQEAHRK